MRSPRSATAWYAAAFGGLVLGLFGVCGGCTPEGNTEERAPERTGDTRQSCAVDTPVGLALEVENGAGKPLRLRAGQTFYLSQIDVRAVVSTPADSGVAALAEEGDFADLAWGHPAVEDEEPILLANADGTFTRRRFYRGAPWMTASSTFTLEQLDAGGAIMAPALTVRSGHEHHRASGDDFFIRRLRAVQWTHDCPGLHDCTGAASFEAEALVELRAALRPGKTFALHPDTAALRLSWSQKPGAWILPVEQLGPLEGPALSYGFSIDVAPLTPLPPGGAYLPGSAVSFRLTLRDGDGNRLHSVGSLPTYNEVLSGGDGAGIQYYRAFFDPTATYWRRKHRERMLMTQIIGPAQLIQPIRSVAPLADFLGPDDVQHVGLLQRDGVFADFKLFPKAGDLFGGAFDPAHAGWSAPVSDTWTYHLPVDAPAGTYLVTVKGRRTFLGEDVAASRTIPIQVGSPEPSAAVLNTGGCGACHGGESAFGKILHANDNRAACNGCHVPLAFELEGPIYVRTHFIHSRSNRFDAPLTRCATCHLGRESIERTSKSACLSCHKSYPAWHEAQFGPVTSVYVGGGPESFERCTSACHTNHPGSHL